jgi:hypothetical protein
MGNHEPRKGGSGHLAAQLSDAAKVVHGTGISRQGRVQGQEQGSVFWREFMRQKQRNSHFCCIGIQQALGQLIRHESTATGRSILSAFCAEGVGDRCEFGSGQINNEENP